jgi:hypothetical protein
MQDERESVGGLRHALDRFPRRLSDADQIHILHGQSENASLGDDAGLVARRGAQAEHR